MRVLTSISESRRAVWDARLNGRRVGLVPTMGALHEGHLSLVRAAHESCSFVAVTIFVNPTQFAPGEDFDRYPRTMDADRTLLDGERVDLLFAPSSADVHAADDATVVHVARLTDGLCGPWRPGHFDGVATVVAKLFNILPADAAFFGEKDFQQLQVVRRMVRDLHIPIDIVGCPTVREPDGLAMSSRNAFLSPQERARAAGVSAALFEAKRLIEAEGARDGDALRALLRDRLRASDITDVDYAEIVDPDGLVPVRAVQSPVRILIAARVGRTRLIDNVAATPAW